MGVSDQAGSRLFTHIPSPLIDRVEMGEATDTVWRISLNRMVRFRHLFAAWCALCLLIAFDLPLAREGSRFPGDSLEVRPRHFRLKVGERIHYQALSRDREGEMRFLKDFEFDTSDPTTLAFSPADGHFLATRHGNAEIILRSGERERRIEVMIVDAMLAKMKTVTDEQVAPFAAEDVLFVNHANRDGFDHTAVAKPSIDRWIHSFKKKGAPVIYFVSQEYPNWYPKDRAPTHAVVTEGGDHNLSFMARRVFLPVVMPDSACSGTHSSPCIGY